MYSSIVNVTKIMTVLVYREIVTTFVTLVILSESTTIASSKTNCILTHHMNQLYSTLNPREDIHIFGANINTTQALIYW